MRTFDQHLLSLVLDGKVAVDAAKRISTNPDDFSVMLKKAGLDPSMVDADATTLRCTMADNRNVRRQGHRRRAINDAVSSPYLADINLAELRSYRQRLMHEEDTVSYWRRLAHARIDVLEAESHTEGSLSMKDLVRVLGDTGAGRTRSALVGVRAAEPLPDLPALTEMWVSEIDPHDREKVFEAVERLHDAERQLTNYRRALHKRIDEATGELISRYRDDPASALIALRK